MTASAGPRFPNSPPPAAVEAEDVVVRDGHSAPVGIRIYRPLSRSDPLPTLIYLTGSDLDPDHENGHDQLARELAVASGAAVAVLDRRSRCPRGREATLERYYAATVWTAERAAPRGLDGRRIAVGGEGSGAGLAVGLALLATRRHRPTLAAQLLLCPLLDSALPSGAGTEAQGLPPALVITAEGDAMHAGGAAYAACLRANGVMVAAVQYLGVGAGFVRRNRAADVPGADAAIAQAAGFVARALGVTPACVGSAAPRRPPAMLGR